MSVLFPCMPGLSVCVWCMCVLQLSPGIWGPCLPRYYKHSGSLYRASHYVVQKGAWRMPNMGTTRPADLKVQISDMQGSSTHWDEVTHRITSCVDGQTVRMIFNTYSIHKLGHLLQISGDNSWKWVYFCFPNEKTFLPQGRKQIFMTHFYFCPSQKTRLFIISLDTAETVLWISATDSVFYCWACKL